MPIRFNCPKCGQELNVKDEMSGKQGKCPKCKSTVTVPSPAAPRPPAAPGRKRPVEEVEEVEVVEEAEIIEDEPPRRRSQAAKKGRNEFDFTDEEDEDEPRRKRRSRRDEEEEDEDEEPRRGKRASARRRRDEDEDDYEDDDEGGSPEKRKKAKERKKRVAFQRATTGMFLNFISMCAYTAAWGVLTLLALIAYIQIISALSSSKPGSGGGGTGLLDFMGYISEGLVYVSLVLCIVGGSFLIMMPGKNGEMGLGIALVATAALSLILAIYLRFDVKLFGAPLAMLGMLVSLGVSGHGGGFGMIGVGLPAVIYFWVLLEMARLCLMGVYQWAVGNTIKEKNFAYSSLVLGIVLPSAVLAMGILFWLIVFIMVKAESKAMVYIGGFFLVAVVGAWTGLLAWFTLHTMSAKDNMEHAR